MAQNKKRKTGRTPVKRHGETLADALYRQRLTAEAVKQAARDATVELEASTRTQRALWLATVSVADAFHVGPKRMKEVWFPTLQANSDELEEMIRENGEEYAYEKLRKKAEAVSGIGIEYLYEEERRGLREKHLAEGIDLDSSDRQEHLSDLMGRLDRIARELRYMGLEHEASTILHAREVLDDTMASEILGEAPEKGG